MKVLILWYCLVACRLAAPIPTITSSSADTELADLQLKLSQARAQIKEIKASIIETFGEGALDKHIDVPLVGSGNEALHYAQMGLENLQFKTLDLVGQIEELKGRGLHRTIPIGESFQDFLGRALKSGSDTVQKVSLMAQEFMSRVIEDPEPDQVSPIKHIPKENPFPALGDTFLKAIRWR